jgi:hypothetical protein
MDNAATDMVIDFSWWGSHFQSSAEQASRFLSGERVI